MAVGCIIVMWFKQSKVFYLLKNARSCKFELSNCNNSGLNRDLCNICSNYKVFKVRGVHCTSHRRERNGIVYNLQLTKRIGLCSKIWRFAVLIWLHSLFTGCSITLSYSGNTNCTIYTTYLPDHKHRGFFLDLPLGFKNEVCKVTVISEVNCCHHLFFREWKAKDWTVTCSSASKLGILVLLAYCLLC